MKKIRFPDWSLNSLDQLRRFLRTVTKVGPWVFAFYSLSLVVFCLIIAGRQAAAAQLAVDVVKSVEGATRYFRLMTALSMIQWCVLAGTLGVLIIWLLLCGFVLFLCTLLLDAVYQLYYKETRTNIVRQHRYLKLFHKKIGKRLIIFSIFIFITIAFIYLRIIRIHEIELTKLIRVYIATISILVPIIYSIVWYNYFKIYRSRKSKSLKNKLDWYLLSKNAIRRRFKSILWGVAVLTLFGWFLLPMLFGSFQWFEHFGTKILKDNVKYLEEWEVLRNEGFSQQEKSITSIAHLPDPNNLTQAISCLDKLGDYETLNNLFSLFQRGLFFIITLLALCEIGIPSIANAIIYGSRREALRKVFLATAKSTILVIVLQLFVAKAFFVDISRALGIGTVFLFAVSFFLMQQSTEIDAKK